MWELMQFDSVWYEYFYILIETPACYFFQFVFQFDNFKRVFKVVEELKGPLVENIRQHFLLSDGLAR